MLVIYGEERVKLGKSASRKLRKCDNKIPSVIYGLNKPILYISLDHHAIFNIQLNKRFYVNNIILNVSHREYVVCVKSVQKHPFKNKLIHIDFLYK
ncbi:50S ribosomal protein L25 [Buchnera aphidicola]|uniref:50S ribosomal protein L25 n=1 Tax=Buchnera aphidicola TaxID=9 RepID=UPI003464AABC